MTQRDQVKEIAERTIDGVGFVSIDGLTVKVAVLDSKVAFGRVDVKVSPVAGSGFKWIDITRLFKEDQK